MRRRNRRVAWLTLLVSLLAATPSVVMADFTTGVVVGTILADDGDDKQDAANNDPQSQTLIDFEQGDTPVVTRVETFPANQWRQVDGNYFICPGKYKDWSSFKDSDKCRIPDDGFNGWAGGTVPGQEQPIQQALEQKEGRSVRLKSIEVNDDTLTAKYQYVAPGQSTNEVEQAPGTTEEPQQNTNPPATEVTEPEQDKPEEQRPSVSSGDPFVSMTGTMVSFMDSTLVKILAGMMLIFGLISGIARQSIGAMFMGVAPAIMLMNAPAVVEAILGVDGTSTGGAATQVPGEPSDGGASMLWMILALAIPPIAFSVYRAWQNRRDEELDELMRDYAARQAGETPRRPSDEPASLDELAQRQRDNEQDNEPVVVSTASSAPKVKEEEPLELQPGKRKIILD